MTLRQKQERTPRLSEFPGRADVWIWDDNNMNRLYGRPEVPESAPRDVRKVADEMLSLGMSDILWNSFEGETPEDCAYLKSKGFLVEKYDIYRDVMPPELAKVAIPYRRKRSVNTPYCEEIGRVDRDGTPGCAWQIHGTDGKMYFQRAVCDVAANWMVRKNVPPDVENVGYTSRFIDVQSGAGPAECWSPAHPCTRRQGLKAIREENEFLSGMNLIAGVEVGSEQTAPGFHFSEGLTSPVAFRAYDAGRRMTTLYYGKDIPEVMDRYMLNPAYRIPLWELVYHDCTVSYYYWGDSTNCCPERMRERDLFCLLYGLPPLYSVDMAGWNKLKKEIAESYRRATASAKKTMFERMTSFEYLSEDKLLQKTTFANGVSVIANFAHEERRVPGVGPIGAVSGMIC